jgi:hypothetical protein
MSRTLKEIHTYTREELEAIAKSTAKMEIVGTIYYGELGEQTVRWNDDGSIDVATTHTPEVR